MRIKEVSCMGRRAWLTWLTDSSTFRPSFISAHDVIAGKKMDSCKHRTAVYCIENESLFVLILSEGDSFMESVTT